jgi:IstB-like ATP binding protein
LSSSIGNAETELLALLVGDEQTRRDSAGLARRLAAAHFEATCAVEDFDFGYNPDIPAGVIRDLAGLGFLAAGQSVILHGPVVINGSDPQRSCSCRAPRCCDRCDVGRVVVPLRPSAEPGPPARSPSLGGRPRQRINPAEPCRRARPRSIDT